MTAKLAKSFFQLILYYFNQDYIVFSLYIYVYTKKKKSKETKWLSEKALQIEKERSEK